MKTVVTSHTATRRPSSTRGSSTTRALAAASPSAPATSGRETKRAALRGPSASFARRFWPGRRFRNLLDLNTQAARSRDDFANGRVHEVTGKVPPARLRATRRSACSSRSPRRPFNTDDVEGMGVTKMFRVPFDRNSLLRSLEARLAAGSSCARMTTSCRSSSKTKQVAQQPTLLETSTRTSSTPSHKRKPCSSTSPARATGTLPPALDGARRRGPPPYFKVLTAGSRSIHRETLRLILDRRALRRHRHSRALFVEVMQTGHVGAEYVEYVHASQGGLVPQPAPLRLGNNILDAISVPDPDLSIYDQPRPDADDARPRDLCLGQRAAPKGMRR